MELRPPMENDANAATAEELEQQAADVYVERALHGPVFRMAYEHVHTYCELFYLRSGTCTYTVSTTAAARYPTPRRHPGLRFCRNDLKNDRTSSPS